MSVVLIIMGIYLTFVDHGCHALLQAGPILILKVTEITPVRK